MTGPEGTAPPRQLRLLVVDDHEVVRQGLVALLDRRPGFQVVAEAGTVAESIEAARRFEPDIIVMDVRLPDGSGIEACREIRAELPNTRVVMLTSYPDDDAVLSAIVAGASGYLLKQVRARDLVAALEAVGRGEAAIGVMPLSEILPAPGLEVAGLFPSAVQDYAVMVAGISQRTTRAALVQSFIDFLMSPGATTVVKNKGMERVP